MGLFRRPCKLQGTVFYLEYPMNKNTELLPYYEKLSTMIEFKEGKPYWCVENGARGKIGNEAGTIKGCRHRYIFMSINKKQKKVSAHRLHWFMTYGYLPINEIDHIDRDTENNSIDNLRECTHAQNMRNRPRKTNGTSRYIGVCRKLNRWRVSIGLGKGKGTKFLGSFIDEREAAIAYDKGCIKYGFHKYSNLNFPELLPSDV